MLKVRPWGITLALVLVAPAADARAFRVNEIPNGGKKGCLNCHLTSAGEHFNGFGTRVKFNLVGEGLNVQEQHVDWGAVYDFDSDSDTFTNGEELGDPNGTWQIGDPNPSGQTYNPGDEDSHPPGQCNNGVLEPDEDCEGAEMRATDCMEIDLGAGTLTCGGDCRFDTTDCSLHTEATGGASAGGGGDEDEGGCTVGRVGADRGPAHRGSPVSGAGGGEPWLFGLLGLLWLARARARRPSRR